MTRARKSAEAGSAEVRPNWRGRRCWAIYGCTSLPGEKSQKRGERCQQYATDGAFCWVHARAAELAKKKQRPPLQTIRSAGQVGK